MSRAFRGTQTKWKRCWFRSLGGVDWKRRILAVIRVVAVSLHLYGSCNTSDRCKPSCLDISRLDRPVYWRTVRY